MKGVENSRKWIHEEVLQRYVRENPKKWKIHGKRVLSIRYNRPFDKYPDLWFSVEGELNEVPVEVEWRSQDFDHDVKILQEHKGMIFCIKKDREDEEIDPSGIVKQFEIPEKPFQAWMKNNIGNLVSDTLSNFNDNDERKTPKLWIKYISKRGNDLKTYHMYGQSETAGIPANAMAVKKFKQVKKNDLIMFLIGGSFAGRKDLQSKKWHQPSFRGTFEKIQVFRITKGYYDSRDTNEREIWGRSKSGEIWPHRFKFDELNNQGKTPLLNLKNIRIRELSTPAKEQLRIAAAVNFIECDYGTLVECVYHSDQLLNSE
tara:strand:+ start:78 stop:1025 length:948 start_codon:yes stop_codon:yes gene_type:complete